MTTTLTFIRHGEYVDNINGVLLDGGLTETGQQQAIALSQRLSEENFRADVLISSTMRRALETADILAGALDLPITQNPDVEEWRNTDGKLTGQQFTRMLQESPVELRTFLKTHATGESWSGFMVRASEAIARIADRHYGQRVVIVCHGGVIEASFMYFCGFSILKLPRIVVDARHTSITEWYQRSETRWQLLRFNDVGHLATLPGGGGLDRG